MKYKPTALPILLTVLLIAMISTQSVIAGTTGELVFRTIFDEPSTQESISSLAHTDKAPEGAACLIADSNGATKKRNIYYTSPAGIMKKNGDYLVTIEYDIIDLRGPFSHFFAVLDNNQGMERPEIHWAGAAGRQGKAVLRATRLASDEYRLQLGIHGSGKIRIRSITITSGNAWEFVSLKQAGGYEQPVHPQPPEKIEIDAPRPKNHVSISVADYGAKTGPLDDDPTVNLNAFHRAIDAARKNNASVLKIPPGAYYFPVDQSLRLDRLEDITIEATGALLVYSVPNRAPAIEITRCNRMVIKGLQIDWDWTRQPLATLARVIQCDSAGPFMDLALLDDFRGDRTKFRYKSSSPLDENRVPADGPENAGLPPVKIEQHNDQTLRIFMRNYVDLKPGDLFLIRHFTYEKRCIYISDSTHLSLDDISIWSFPGMGFVIDGKTHHWQLINSRITHQTGAWRPITTTADGIHIIRSCGYFRIENCDFGHMGDDCINIKDNSVSGVEILNANSLRVRTYPGFFTKGDLIEIRDPDFLSTGFLSPITHIAANSDGTFDLTFMDSFDRPISEQSILFNREYNSSQFIIRNNRFHENRARGLLIQASRGIVEHNIFFRNQHSAIQIESGTEQGWSEGYGVMDVLIQHNTFDGCNRYGAYDYSAIYIKPYLPYGPTEYFVFRDIRFSENQFLNLTGRAFLIESAENIQISRNSFINATASPAAGSWGDIQATLTRNLIVTSNTWNNPQKNNVTLRTDPKTATGTTCRDNIINGNP